MSRTLNIPSLGFDVVVFSKDKKVEEMVGKLIEDKVAVEVEDEYPEPDGCPHCGNVEYRGCTC